MNILAIGNSFSEDATRYLHEIAAKDSEDLTVVNLCIGGCSLEQHCKYLFEGTKNYLLQINGAQASAYVTLDEVLQDGRWDVVTVQQVSHMSFDRTTYEPYIYQLVSHIRSRLPSARLYLHQTWAYEADSDRLLNMAGYPTPDKMLADIVRVTREIAEAAVMDGIIPSGELLDRIGKLTSTPLHRDTFHASLGLGRYALGLLWYRVICGQTASQEMSLAVDEPIASEDISAAHACVKAVTEK